MPGWFRHFRKRALPPLTGAPDVRRIKTYSAASGYVYQYVYEGRRPLSDSVEYVFSVSSDRSRFVAVSIVIRDDSIETWQAAHGRELADAERYGIAKMGLWAALDERARPEDLAEPSHIGPDEIERLAESLGLE